MRAPTRANAGCSATAPARRCRRGTAAGSPFTARYDALRRPTALLVAEGTGAPRTAEQTAYGETMANPSSLTPSPAQPRTCSAPPISTTTEPGARRRCVETSRATSFRSSRELLVDLVDEVDWSSSPALTGEVFTASSSYDALNRLVTTTAPDGSVTTAGVQRTQPARQSDRQPTGRRRRDDHRGEPSSTTPRVNGRASPTATARRPSTATTLRPSDSQSSTTYGPGLGACCRTSPTPTTPSETSPGSATPPSRPTSTTTTVVPRRRLHL